MSSRLLVISTGVPHPSIGANVVAQHTYLSAFRDAGYRILHVMLVKEGVDNPNDAERHRKEFSNESIRILPVRVPGFLAAGRRFFQSFQPTSLPWDIAEAVKEFSPDLCFCMDIAAAGVRSELSIPAKTLVWLGDLNFEVSWYRAWYAAREHWTSVFALPLAWWESCKWRAYYANTLSKVERVIVTAKSSETALKRLGIRSTYLPYSWPAPPLPASVPPRPLQPTFVFFGHLSGLGSRSAFHFLVEKLYPRLVSLWGKGEFCIMICGIHAVPLWAQQALVHAPEVRILGFVDDLAEMLLSSHGVIVPIDVPIGNRTRIITAMALGAPVIAHTNTALGNPSLVDGETCFLGRDADTFVERMQQLVHGGKEVEHMIRNAKLIYEREYHPAQANRAMLEELRRLLG